MATFFLVSGCVYSKKGTTYRGPCLVESNSQLNIRFPHHFKLRPGDNYIVLEPNAPVPVVTEPPPDIASPEPISMEPVVAMTTPAIGRRRVVTPPVIVAEASKPVFYLEKLRGGWFNVTNGDNKFNEKSMRLADAEKLMAQLNGVEPTA